MIVDAVMRRKDPRLAPRYSAKLVSRVTSTTMYASKPCDTREDAVALAEAYLKRNAQLVFVKRV